VSTDQFVCRTPGRLPSGYGHEGCNGRFHGGTIYNDAASGLIWFENQVSLGASETIMGKKRFEQWLYDTTCVEVKHFHGNNGIFFIGEVPPGVFQEAAVAIILGCGRAASEF
jgi:hypothetical protein